MSPISSLTVGVGQSAPGERKQGQHSIGEDPCWWQLFCLCFALLPVPVDLTVRTSRSLPIIKDFTSNLRHHKGKSFMIATFSLVLLLAFHALKIATHPGSGAIIKDLCSRVLYDCDALGTALTRGPPPRHKGSKIWHPLLLVVAPEVQQHQRRAADPPAEAADKAAALPRVAPLQPQPQQTPPAPPPMASAKTFSKARSIPTMLLIFARPQLMRWTRQRRRTTGEGRRK